MCLQLNHNSQIYVLGNFSSFTFENFHNTSTIKFGNSTILCVFKPFSITIVDTWPILCLFYSFACEDNMDKGWICILHYHHSSKVWHGSQFSFPIEIHPKDDIKVIQGNHQNITLVDQLFTITHILYVILTIVYALTFTILKKLKH